MPQQKCVRQCGIHLAVLSPALRTVQLDEQSLRSQTRVAEGYEQCTSELRK